MHMTQAHDNRPSACARDEHGFTLIELLVSMLVATVITGAAFSFLIFTTEDVAHVTARVGVDQAGRVAMQQMVSELDSGCIEPNAHPIETGSNATTLIFLSEAGEQSAFPTLEKHEIIFTEGTGTTQGTLVENAYVSNEKKEYPKTPTTKRLLLTGVQQTKYGSEKATPIFRYYRYYHEGDSPPAGEGTVPYGEVDPTPVTSLTAETLLSITKVTIAFTLAPEGKEVISFNKDRPVVLEDSALFRLDPSSETPSAKNLPCEKP